MVPLRNVTLRVAVEGNGSKHMRCEAGLQRPATTKRRPPSSRVRSTQALNLLRDVLAASASIPVVFPPMLIDAEANGHRFQEMHVDGGVTAPVLTLPEAFLLRNGALARGLSMNIYIQVNNKVERDFQLVPNSTIDNRREGFGFRHKDADPLHPRRKADGSGRFYHPCLPQGKPSKADARVPHRDGQPRAIAANR
jgi:predicted acylesterase/phospholipase RssA